MLSEKEWVADAQYRSEEQSVLDDIARSIRALSIDAIEAAGCGHPGLPMGCAELMAFLYAKVLKHNPKNPDWINRDRFILSAGHGSMALYSALHLAGFEVSLDDIKAFRQLHSNTPGHPEFGMTPGVETTTGPLGQGVVTASGMALAHKMKAAQFDAADLLDSSVYVLAGDGDLMEGVSSEAASLAGHLALDNLIVLYDANDICLDGPISECFTEDVKGRYEAYGWFVTQIDGHDFSAISEAILAAQASNKPALIIAKTVIGKGAPNVEGTSEVHGKALGESEAKLAKERLGIPESPLFWVPESVRAFFNEKVHADAALEAEWQGRFDAWRVANSDKAAAWDASVSLKLPENIAEIISGAACKENGATRQASNAVLQVLEGALPYFVVGSADLSCSDNTVLKGSGMVTADDFSGRNIKFGVREFAMSAMVTGMALHKMTLPLCGTFMTFSDYMRNAIRLAALMEQRVIYHFTHDSIFLGEDGPTHQPVEHLASLRAMPGLTVLRPADATETKGAWLAALQADGPVAMVLTRLAAPDLSQTSMMDVSKGAYVVLESETDAPDVCLLATGSEVALALDVAKHLAEKSIACRVVSMPSFELFDAQDEAYRNAVLGNASLYCSIEAQSSFGWHRYVGRDGLTISVDRYGESAPAGELRSVFGFTPEQIVARILAKRG